MMPFQSFCFLQNGFGAGEVFRIGDFQIVGGIRNDLDMAAVVEKDLRVIRERLSGGMPIGFQ